MRGEHTSPFTNNMLQLPPITTFGGDSKRKRSFDDSVSEAGSDYSQLWSKIPRKSSWIGGAQLPRTPPESAAGSPSPRFYEHVADNNCLAPLRLSPETSSIPRCLPSYRELLGSILKTTEKYHHLDTVTTPPQSPASRRDSVFGSQQVARRDPRYFKSPIASSPQMPTPNGSHINKKYTDEENDFIIYAYHDICKSEDKNTSWKLVEEMFASMFGTAPLRTVQGLQANYYRENKKLPVVDEEGYLVFEDEMDLEPEVEEIPRRQTFRKCTLCRALVNTCKSRERGMKTKVKCGGLCRWTHCPTKLEKNPSLKNMPGEPCGDCRSLVQLGPKAFLGLAGRYPDRALRYSWVNSEVKAEAQDLAAKRAEQYRKRREHQERLRQDRMQMRRAR